VSKNQRKEKEAKKSRSKKRGKIIPGLSTMIREKAARPGL